MKKNNRILEFAARYVPGFHRRYREMCSLAAVGQLGGPQMCDLNEHIAACGPCRSFLQQVAQASVQVLPVVAEGRVPPSLAAPPSGIRARFLARLAAEKADRRIECSTASQQVLVAREESPQQGGARRAGFRIDAPAGIDTGAKGARPLRSFLWGPALGAVGATIVFVFVGFHLGGHFKPPVPQVDHEKVPAAAISPAAAPSDDSERVRVLDQEKQSLRKRLAEAEEKLSLAESRRKELADKFNDVTNELAALTAQPSVRQTHSEDESQARIAMLQNELSDLRKQSDDAKAGFASKQKENNYLREKLELTEENLQQELARKDAKSRMGDLAAARNLHIVDVYDADRNGNRQRAFGRVFYEEGKSLVFYAYDLDDAGRHQGNVVFHVWGGKAGVKEVTHSLGILQRDRGDESRWAMTFDDPKVLAQINSVFVTAESAGKRHDGPHGKKVLYAYFGSAPNHP